MAYILWKESSSQKLKQEGRSERQKHKALDTPKEFDLMMNDMPSDIRRQGTAPGQDSPSPEQTSPAPERNIPGTEDDVFASSSSPSPSPSPSPFSANRGGGTGSSSFPSHSGGRGGSSRPGGEKLLEAKRRLIKGEWGLGCGGGRNSFSGSSGSSGGGNNGGGEA